MYIFIFHLLYRHKWVTDNIVVDEQIEKVEIDMDTNTGIFAVGVTTIDKMNAITMEITSDNLERLSGVIVNLKSAVEKYKSIGRMTDPKGSRCFRGFKVNLPLSLAVSSPKRYAMYPWENSWITTDIIKTNINFFID